MFLVYVSFQMSNARLLTARTWLEGRLASSQEMARHLSITLDDLHRCLYQSNEVTFISKEDLRPSLQQKQEIKIYCESVKCIVCVILI